MPDSYALDSLLTWYNIREHIFEKFIVILQPNSKKSYLWSEEPFNFRYRGEKHGRSTNYRAVLCP